MYDNLSREISQMRSPLWRGPIVEIKANIKPLGFGGDPIIDSYRVDELLMLRSQGKRISDFLSDINSSIEEQAILKSWTDWFTFKKVPWAVTKGRRYRLWKIWEGMTDKEMREKERDPTIHWKK